MSDPMPKQSPWLEVLPMPDPVTDERSSSARNAARSASAAPRPPDRAVTDEREKLSKQDLRDLASVERFAKSVLRQCEFLRKNGAGDTIRWGYIAGEAWRTWRVSAKADRRAAKANGWTIYRWFIPRGYDRG